MGGGHQDKKVEMERKQGEGREENDNRGQEK